MGKTYADVIICQSITPKFYFNI